MSIALNNFCENSFSHSFDLGNTLKKYLNDNKLYHNNITEETLLYAVEELFKAFSQMNIKDYDLDNFRNCNMSIFDYEEDTY